MDALVALEPDSEGATKVTTLPHYEMARILTSCWCAIGDSSVAPVAELARLAAGAECLSLRVGSLDAAVVTFQEALC